MRHITFILTVIALAMTVVRVHAQNLREVGHYNTPGFAYSVFVTGDYVYVAADVEGLRVIDISDPQNPREVGFYDTPGYAYDVAISGDYAYVADRGSGLRVI